MVDRQCKGLCYNYDEKFVKGHKCKEHKLFHMDMQESPTIEEVIPEGPQPDPKTELRKMFQRKLLFPSMPCLVFLPHKP